MSGAMTLLTLKARMPSKSVPFIQNNCGMLKASV
jgi:hypothetical protein